MKTIKIKTMLCAAAVALGVVAFGAPGDGGSLRVVVQKAMAVATDALKAAPIPADQPVAVLPVDADVDGWFEGQVKNALTSAGKTCVTGKDDPMWEEILKELEWSTRKADIFDPATLTVFGKLKTARILMTAAVPFSAETPRYTFAELELHAVSLETKQHLWGTTIPMRKYKDEEKIVGISQIPVEVRRVALDKLRAAAVNSLKKLGKPGLGVSVLPLAGDQDAYVTGVMRDSVSAAGLVPVNLAVATRAEARLAMREQNAKSTAFLSGAVRDISATLVKTTPNSSTYRIDVEVQAVIEEAASHMQLWSETLSVTEDYTTEQGVWDMLCGWFPSLRGKPWLVVAVPLGVMLLLIVLVMFFKATTRVR